MCVREHGVARVRLINNKIGLRRRLRCCEWCCASGCVQSSAGGWERHNSAHTGATRAPQPPTAAPTHKKHQTPPAPTPCAHAHTHADYAAPRVTLVGPDVCLVVDWCAWVLQPRQPRRASQEGAHHCERISRRHRAPNGALVNKCQLFSLLFSNVAADALGILIK